ncbi:cytochrome P450 [Cryphonectria parasitica EP155]|uniref:Cytochrome P450 n=1 Tax=Cryphonectria parasitica (strain ATCC 38755 / EP155) TaxID=660469 RepID=A0A9P4Y076_CRYP1|nr:cytochrome P450 [Cryphonectria parasitica EP155]KAF3764589.1 cytochrome P450 [Cryphonectria parasitica EP155]
MVFPLEDTAFMTRPDNPNHSFTGDIVRIAPNELVFITPQAAKESFVQVGYDALDTGDGGISGETNPVKHREIAKKLAPAFSTRNFKAKEAAVQRHIDAFIQKMKEIGAGEKGAEMQCWTDRLGLDLSFDMTYSRVLGQIRDMKDSTLLNATLKLNFFLTMSQITRKFRLFSPFIYLTIPPSVWFMMPRLIKMNTQDFKERIDRRGKTEHLDYFEQLVPADQPAPEDKKQLYNLENVAGQLLLASWQPLANQFYSCILFLLGEPDAYAALVDEIRSSFANYEAISSETIASLKYLQACAQESFRLHQDTVDGLPRVSPGAMVDGVYIPQGVTCQISYFTAARNPRFFTEPLRFRPQRWLPEDHPKYDPKYRDDNLKASKPFSQGPRGCPGGAIASAVLRLFLAKVLWQFDLEAVPAQRGISFEKDFKFLTFWERSPFWVRFKIVERGD